ncbi:hypothetical protein H0H93_004238 [Arthromyces matolae]|nr:hypothetical protein H0H93_004238 [Arthromyces matolae]
MLMNCMNIYNHALSVVPGAHIPSSFDNKPSKSMTITAEQVSRGFYLNALLRDSIDKGTTVVLPDKGDNDQRMAHAIEHRNNSMILEGQPERMHACSVCERIIPHANGNGVLRSLRAATMDGTGLGRTCCKEHNCAEPPVKLRSHFCATHEHKNSECVVVDCSEQAPTGFQTCENQEHRKLEEHRHLKKKAFFQLKHRLQKRQLSQLTDTLDPSDHPDDNSEDEPEENVYKDSVKKSDQGNRPPKARFERRRTHNEQLLVACCGMILARSTMFGAESITGAKVDFLKSVCPQRIDLPSVIFYDSNCILKAHLIKNKDDYFDHILLPVDVFHFKTKHKETDTFCQEECNPAKFQELLDEEENWIFNSSVAEQVNVWLGGYKAIVRDMLPHRYDFFLDEMIKRRNELLHKKLWDAGHIPYTIQNY